MKVRTLLAVAVAGAFAVPFAAQAKDPSVTSDSFTIAQATDGGSTPRNPASGDGAGGTTSGQGTGNPERGTVSPRAADRAPAVVIPAPVVVTPAPAPSATTGGSSAVRSGASASVTNDASASPVNPASGDGAGGTTTGSGTGNPEFGRNSARGASGATFSSMDTNRDGYISREEARNWAHFNRYDALDANRDGRISAEEYNAAASAGASAPRTVVVPAPAAPAVAAPNSAK